MGATRSDALLIYRAAINARLAGAWNIGEDAVSTTIGKQLATIRRLFDRVDRMEAAKIPWLRGGRKRCGARSRRVVIFDAPFQTRFQGVRNERDPCKRGGEETVQSVGDPVIIEGFRVSRVEEYRYGSKVNWNRGLKFFYLTAL